MAVARPKSAKDSEAALAERTKDVHLALVAARLRRRRSAAGACQPPCGRGPRRRGRGWLVVSVMGEITGGGPSVSWVNTMIALLVPEGFLNCMTWRGAKLDVGMSFLKCLKELGEN